MLSFFIVKKAINTFIKHADFELSSNVQIIFIVGICSILLCVALLMHIIRKGPDSNNHIRNSGIGMFVSSIGLIPFIFIAVHTFVILIISIVLLFLTVFAGFVTWIRILNAQKRKV